MWAFFYENHLIPYTQKADVFTSAFYITDKFISKVLKLKLFQA